VGTLTTPLRPDPPQTLHPYETSSIIQGAKRQEQAARTSTAALQLIDVQQRWSWVGRESERVGRYGPAVPVTSLRPCTQRPLETSMLELYVAEQSNPSSRKLSTTGLPASLQLG
jgi:hypothetical protein